MLSISLNIFKKVEFDQINTKLTPPYETNHKCYLYRAGFQSIVSNYTII